MKRYFSVLFVAFLAGTLFAQEAEVRPQRTPEEEAAKQTTRLTRELDITDSARIDTLFRMHVKYARMRRQGLTRAQNMERLQSFHAELKSLLTPDEFERFMNHPVEQPRRPRGANVNSNEAPNRQRPQTERQ